MPGAFTARQFSSDDEIKAIGEGLLDRSLAKVLWTHEAHFAATTYLILKHPELDLEHELPHIISAYNVSVGGMNTDSSGYHETITQMNLRLVREFLSSHNSTQSLFEICNELVRSPICARDYLLKFYSKELLFSVRARKTFVAGDLI